MPNLAVAASSDLTAALVVVLGVGLFFALVVLMVLCWDRNDQIMRLKRQAENVRQQYDLMQSFYLRYIGELSDELKATRTNRANSRDQVQFFLPQDSCSHLRRFLPLE